MTLNVRVTKPTLLFEGIKSIYRGALQSVELCEKKNSFISKWKVVSATVYYQKRYEDLARKIEFFQ